jgi:hypothetical protein
MFLLSLDKLCLLFVAVEPQTNGLQGLAMRQSQQQQSNGLAASKTSIEAQTGRREQLHGRLGPLPYEVGKAGNRCLKRSNYLEE